MIVFTKRLLNKLFTHAAEESAQEVCGVLGGTKKEGSREVYRVYNCTNVDPDSDVGYEINPVELLRVMDDVEDRNLEIIGFYHSHPMALAKPSMIDISKATWPGHSYVIISPKSTASITSWVLDEKEGFVEEEVVVK
ncbi:MAG: M67 family metallopeptidase [Desulfatiglandales bacterium]